MPYPWKNDKITMTPMQAQLLVLFKQLSTRKTASWASYQLQCLRKLKLQGFGITNWLEGSDLAAASQKALLILSRKLLFL